MPERRKKAAASDEDRISSLPDALLLHTLSLLPSEEAVRTCVLARRWRNLWRYTPSLRLIQDSDFLSSAEQFNKFVSHLIVLRDRSPLVDCEIVLDPDYPNDRGPCQYIQAVQLWIQYALACQDTESAIGVEGNHVPAELSFVCTQLKVANIECQELDGKVLKIWIILRTCGVHPEKISIKIKHAGFYHKLAVVISSCMSPVLMGCSCFRLM